MDLQTAFNIAVGFGAFLGGWVLNTMWGEIRSGKSDSKAISDRVTAVEILVAGQYVPRAELDAQFTKIGNALDRIETALHSKADK